MSSRQKVQSHEHKSVSIPVPTQTPGTDLQSLYGNSFLSHEMEATEDDGGTGLFSHPGAISLSSSPAPPSARPDGGDEPVIPEHLVEELWKWILDDGDTAPSHLQNQEMAERVPAPEAPLDWWESYAAEADRTLRRRWVFQACDDGSVRALIDALPKDILSLDTSPYEENLDEVLDFVQQHATRQASGKSLAELGEIQGAYMHSQARQHATEQNGMHATPEQIEDVRQQIVSEQSYLSPNSVPEWYGLGEPEQASRTQRGKSVIRAIVTDAAHRAPELGLRADQIVLDYPGCEESGALAYTQGDGLCHLSWAAVQAAEVNPALMLSTVVHELAGHPEFDRGHSVSGNLFQHSRPHIPGYQKPIPGSPEAAAEYRRFFYFESEIASLLREYRYWLPLQEQGSNSHVGNPIPLLDQILDQVRTQWAPEVQRPWLMGLSVRFQTDPRIGAEAHRLYLERVQIVLGIQL